MRAPRRVLILGASYGALFGIRLAAAGHHATLVAVPYEVDCINEDGCRVRLPVRGRDGHVEIHSKALAGHVDAAVPDVAEPARYDLIVLAMQEPQYRAPAIRRLLAAVAASGRPVLSIMNMPPLPFLERIAALEGAALKGCYTDESVWDGIDASRVSHCSADPQAFRPAGEPPNVLQVRLATNFKAAPFAIAADQQLLKEIADSISAVRVSLDGDMVDLPVKLRPHRSLHVPLAKWPMLIAGSYRCLETEPIVSIREAVHRDLAFSRQIYDEVAGLCLALGADEDDLVAFARYAEAARALESPSSAMRALASGAVHIERVDKLVATIADHLGRPISGVDAIVARVDALIARNRIEAA
jgi:hypothetical protein